METESPQEPDNVVKQENFSTIEPIIKPLFHRGKNTVVITIHDRGRIRSYMCFFKISF